MATEALGGDIVKVCAAAGFAMGLRASSKPSVANLRRWCVRTFILPFWPNTRFTLAA